jgi:transposase InsO family protein
MKENFRHIGLAKLCGWFGITRQAYYQNSWAVHINSVEDKLVLDEVNKIRLIHRRMGTRKLYELLQTFMLEHSIKMGRDALFDLLAANGLLIRKKRSCIITTSSNHMFRKYPNLIKNLVPCRINELWVSDITYWQANNGFYYVSLITDAYSHKIVGYHVAENLSGIHCLQALQMATKTLEKVHEYQLIHHSDRGLQYCSNNYIRLLEKCDIAVSMTEHGDPLENAIAERVNGILKQEYLDFYKPENINEAMFILSKTIKLYNEQRPHMSIGNLKPNQVHKENLQVTERLWKNYYHKQNHVL